NRGEVLEGVVGKLTIEELVERMPACHQHECVAVGSRLDQRLRCNYAAGARPVVDHGQLTPGLRHRLSNRARQPIDGPPRRIGYEDAHWLRREGLRDR